MLCRVALGGICRMRGYGAEHVPPTGPAILACNHQSYLDPVLVGAFTTRGLHYMARDTLFRNRLFGRLIRSYNAFPVKRGAADLTAIKHSLRVLADGCALLLFPEGTRSHDGRVAPMHAGVMAIARRSQAPLIPVAVDGVFEAWPRSRRLPRWARVYVAFGPPIESVSIAALDDHAAANLLTDRIRTLQNEIRARAGRKPFEYPAPDGLPWRGGPDGSASRTRREPSQAGVDPVRDT